MTPAPNPNTPASDERPKSPHIYESNFAIPLSPAELLVHHARLLAMPTYRYGLPARVLF